jgi:hypothetical protein
VQIGNPAHVSGAAPVRSAKGRAPAHHDFALALPAGSALLPVVMSLPSVGRRYRIGRATALGFRQQTRRAGRAGLVRSALPRRHFLEFPATEGAAVWDIAMASTILGFGDIKGDAWWAFQSR